MTGATFHLESATRIANRLVEILGPYCERIEVVGSIRRRKKMIHDIDLVVIPNSISGLGMALMRHGQLLTKKRIDSKTKIIKGRYQLMPVDIYLADEQTWPMLLLVRTGSAEHNQKLAMLAKRKGLHFAADGQGILDGDGKRISGDTEVSIFEALGLEWVPPEGRE
jgi:DNA polymerase (family 10)